MGKRVGVASKTARDDRQTHFGTFEYWKCRFLAPEGGKNMNFFGFIRVLGGRYCLKPIGEKAGIVLRRENFGFPGSKKLKP